MPNTAELKSILKSQYKASLEMLREAVAACQEASWNSDEHTNPFWHIAYYALFYTHLYLQHHTGQLIDRIREQSGKSSRWIGGVPT